jgi:DNA-binding CsgD family transcriptional regulator
VKNEDETAQITVEVRLSDDALARRVHAWLGAGQAFVEGAAQGACAVMIADHVPDDATGPIVLLASAGGLASWPRDPRVAARLEPDVGLTTLRIAVEAAAHGLSVGESRRDSGAGGRVNLTAREQEVLRRIVDGASNKAIARALGISSHTVKFHTAAILEKLGASSRTEAAMQAIRLGLVIF